MLTNKAKYSLRAMCALAGLAAGERLQAHAIADRARVPVKFLETILVDLRRAGFIESRRGQLGGHALALPAGEIMVGDVIILYDGKTFAEPFQVMREIMQARVGEAKEFEIIRGDRRLTIKVTFGSRPKRGPAP